MMYDLTNAQIAELKKIKVEYDKISEELKDLRSRYNWLSYQNSIHELVKRQKELQNQIDKIMEWW